MTRGSYKHTKEHNQKISQARMGEGNGMYKASEEKSALHIYMHKRVPKPNLCQCCNKEKPYDLANISGEYKRETSDWQWLCRSCHMNSDGRKNNLVHGRKPVPSIICKNCRQLKIHYGLGLCHSCYDKQRWIKRKQLGCSFTEALQFVKDNQ